MSCTQRTHTTTATPKAPMPRHGNLWITASTRGRGTDVVDSKKISAKMSAAAPRATSVGTGVPSLGAPSVGSASARRRPERAGFISPGQRPGNPFGASCSGPAVRRPERAGFISPGQRPGNPLGTSRRGPAIRRPEGAEFVSPGQRPGNPFGISCRLQACQNHRAQTGVGPAQGSTKLLTGHASGVVDRAATPGC